MKRHPRIAAIVLIALAASTVALIAPASAVTVAAPPKVWE